MKVTLENVMFVVACLFIIYALYLAYVLFRMYMGFRRLATEDKVKKFGGNHTT
jgi:preprotein translocase subunit SecG